MSPYIFGFMSSLSAKTPPFFSTPQGLQQQSLLVRTHYIVVDIVAHHGVETLIREVQLVGVPLLEPAPGANTLTGGIFLAHSLVVAEVYAPIVNARYFYLRPHQGRPDG